MFFVSLLQQMGFPSATSSTRDEKSLLQSASTLDVQPTRNALGRSRIEPKRGVARKQRISHQESAEPTAVVVSEADVSRLSIRPQGQAVSDPQRSTFVKTSVKRTATTRKTVPATVKGQVAAQPKSAATADTKSLQKKTLSKIQPVKQSIAASPSKKVPLKSTALEVTTKIRTSKTGRLKTATAETSKVKLGSDAKKTVKASAPAVGAGATSAKETKRTSKGVEASYKATTKADVSMTAQAGATGLKKSRVATQATELAASQTNPSPTGSKSALKAAAVLERTAKSSPAPVAPSPRPLGKRAAKKVMMQQMAQAAVQPTHSPNAAKATFSTMNERAMTFPAPYTVQKDPKRANNWKSMPVEQLTDQDVLAMPDNEYMNDVQLAFFRRKLMQLKADMLTNAGETTEHLREETAVVPDPADRATIEEEHALELRTRDRERKLLKKIEQSIVRIDSGDYGYCDETGESIGVGRLLARPTANLCLEAQQRRELKQKMFGD